MADIVTVKASPTINKIKIGIEAPARLVEQARVSSADHQLKHGRNPLGHTALVKIAYCIELLDKVEPILWPSEKVVICKDWRLSLSVFQRCWNDFNADRDGIRQTELFSADAFTGSGVKGRFE